MEKCKSLATQNDDNLFAVLKVIYFKNCGKTLASGLK